MSPGHPRDEPWIFRTYAGYATPALTNARFVQNLAKGQTGLSVAFDLPTQTGYDSDHEMARGEVGRVGVPICHLGDMRTVFEGVSLSKMNTSMTINATAAWLLALYVAEADEQGAGRATLAGTTQNDILKEFLARGTYVFPPGPSLRLTTDLIAWTLREAPRWNPINVCSYHLQEAGADPVLEIAFALANAICVLDSVRASGQVSADDFPRLVGRVSFFVNAGIRFVEEMCKVRAFVSLWDRVCLERYGVEEVSFRRFRFGVQVNSLGLTAQQPENNVYRILLEMLGVTLSKHARARAVQLPAWNEAIGLPRAWDQQWSLRAQQILAEETDLLEHQDLFAGSKVVEDLTSSIETRAWEELTRVLEMGGSVEALGYMKERLVASLALRLNRIESGEQTVVGVNSYEEGEPSPLGPGVDAVEHIGQDTEEEQIERLEAWRKERDDAAARRALDALREAASTSQNLVPPSIEAAKAGVTTGEWADALRDVFGEYRGPTGISAAVISGSVDSLSAARGKVAEAAARLGVRKLRLLVAKPGLDGHSNAAEQVALRARDCGFEVIYQGIRLSPAQIARAAADEDVHAIGLSILSGGHMLLVPKVLSCLREEGVTAPVVVGGIIPDEDAKELLAIGVSRVFTPTDHDLTESVAAIAELL
jgi:(2R)-ethylmalonyl-CoA mutase